MKLLGLVALGLLSVSLSSSKGDVILKQTGGLEGHSDLDTITLSLCLGIIFRRKMDRNAWAVKEEHVCD